MKYKGYTIKQNKRGICVYLDNKFIEGGLASMAEAYDTINLYTGND